MHLIKKIKIFCINQPLQLQQGQILILNKCDNKTKVRKKRKDGRNEVKSKVIRSDVGPMLETSAPPFYLTVV